MSKPTKEKDIVQLSVWMPRTLLDAVEAKGRRQGLTQRMAIARALRDYATGTRIKISVIGAAADVQVSTDGNGP